MRALGRFLILRAHKFQTAALRFHPHPGFHRRLTPRKFYPFRLTPWVHIELRGISSSGELVGFLRIHPPQKRVLNSESARESWSEGQRNYATDIRIKLLRSLTRDIRRNVDKYEKIVRLTVWVKTHGKPNCPLICHPIENMYLITIFLRTISFLYLTLKLKLISRIAYFRKDVHKISGKS